MAKKRKKTFFEIAKRHIIKVKPGDDPHLSQRIDEILYGELMDNYQRVSDEEIEQMLSNLRSDEPERQK